MKAELISIGDEILLGHIINSNASYISQKLTEIGIEVKWITTIGDNEDDLLSALKQAEQRADVTISTGGLGPTHDDRTKKICAIYFNSTGYFLDEDVLNKIKAIFRRRNIPMPKVNEEQALIPNNAQKVNNEIGTAPGLLFNRSEKQFFFLPGVPMEMKTIIDHEIIPLLKPKSTQFIKYRILKTTGISESQLFENIENIDEIEKHVTVAFLPKSTGIEMRITAIGSNENQCHQRIDDAEIKLTKNIKQYIWGYDDERLEDVIGDLLKEKNKTLAVIESSTGGLICHKLTNNPETASSLLHAMIINSVESVATMLKLPPLSMKDEKVSGSQLAIAMAKEIRTMCASDIGIATTPFLSEQDHGSTLLSSGNVYFAIIDDQETVCDKLFVNRDMNFNKERIAQVAMDLLRRQLIKSSA